jgi:hypothetical protein
MRKKGVIFTVFTLLLFGSILLMIIALANYYEGFTENYVSNVGSGSKIAMIKADFAYDLISELEWENVTLERMDNNFSVYFDSFYNSSRNYSSNLENYEKIIEDNFSTQINWDIELENLIYGFGINPYYVHTSWSGEKFYVYNDVPDLVKRIEVKVLVNNYSKLTSIPSISDTGSQNTEFYVQVIDRHGSNFFYHKRLIDSSVDNDPSKISFDNGQSFEANYESLSGRDGVFWMNIPGNVSVINLKIVYVDINRTAEFFVNGTLHLKPRANQIHYVGPMVIEG